MKQYPLDVGGLMGLIMFIFYITNGHEEDVGWRYPDAWWM